MRPSGLTLVFLLVSAPLLAQRLPGDVVPEHYDLAVTPDLVLATFVGRERIDVTVKKPTATVVINAAEIQFDTVTVTAGGRTQQAKVSLEPSSQQATLTLAAPVAAGEAAIEIAYRGILNDQLRGLYLSRTSNRRYAVTQLAATDARRMFPSFDEPAFKATFTLTAIIDAGDSAISNGAMASDTPGPGVGKHTVRFETTPTMSTYLVALAVGDFVCEGATTEGTPIRICSTPDKKGQTGFALEAAQEILRYYNRYYAVKYPFKKLDVVAVPDFSAGAMENTAALFFREALLLADPATASLRAKKSIASGLAHEMAHQWFGDLVTMNWWDDIWLNEGFASWMETKPIKAWKPEWHMELEEIQSNQRAMSLDTLRSTRPIRARANTPDEIIQLFDAIAYEKGAAVLRMIEAWVGEEPFREGVNAYIDRFKLSNARAEDFWGTLTSSTGKPVDRVMAGFVDQPGVPLVDAAVECGAQDNTASITQEPAGGAAARPRVWSIPVCVRTPADKVSCTVVGGDPASVPVDTCPAWLMANAGARGYYRVVSPPEMVRAMARDVGSLKPSERIAVLADEWALVKLGRHEIGTLLDLASGFKGERSPVVMGTLIPILARIDEELAPASSRAKYHAWVASLLRAAMEDIGWTPAPGEPEDRAALRARLVYGLGGIARDPDVTAKARELVLSELAKPGSVSSTLLNAAIPIAAHGGDTALYEKYLERSRKASDPEEHDRYMYALAGFSDPALVHRTMEYVVGPEVRSQDAKLFLAQMIRNRDIRDLAWQLTQSRWDEIQKKSGDPFGTGLIVGALSAFCDASRLGEIQRFFQAHPVADAERPLAQTMERIGECAVRSEKQGPKLVEWLLMRAPAF